MKDMQSFPLIHPTRILSLLSLGYNPKRYLGDTSVI
jgi:hypothetical protein